MRIDWLRVHNFKCFAEREFEFPRRLDAPQNEQGSFHLLIGDNGTGKTSVLDALAVAMGIWLVELPDSKLFNSRRNILSKEIRLEGALEGDRIQFREHLPVEVDVRGQILEHDNIPWKRQIRSGGTRTTNADAQKAIEIIKQSYSRDENGGKNVYPILTYYGAGRGWLSSRELSENKQKQNGVARRWQAFYDCFNERIRKTDLVYWFRCETIASVNRQGRMRPGFEAVRRAILRAVPGADGVWFDVDRDQIVLSLDGVPQPFDNLSAGQRMMLALIADIAIKCVTQNAFLLPPDVLGEADEPLPQVLRRTPGMVLIDEIDVHLHPTWQRHVIRDLRETFPNIQFVATSHSPFLVQSLRDGELILMDEGKQPVPNFGNKGIETIAKGLMDVPRPEVSEEYGNQVETAKEYLETLEEAKKAPEEKLEEYKERLASKIGPYADNPAFQAFLEMKRIAAIGE